MAKIETHCKDCLQVLGKEYKEVHKWLDEYSKQYDPFIHLEYHRKFRHHEQGVKEAEKLFGYYGSQAAKLHIIRDYEFYVYFNIDKLRENDIEKLYKKALEFCHDPQRDS